MIKVLQLVKLQRQKIELKIMNCFEKFLNSQKRNVLEQIARTNKFKRIT